VSPLGDAMATTALILHLQRTTGTATAVALLLFVEAVPPIAAPVAGVIADRVAPRRLLATGLAAQAAVVAVVALWLPALAPLLVLLFLLATVATPLPASVGRAIASLVADEDLPGANALQGGVRELGTVIGPPVAGLLFAASGTRLVLAVDAVTFLVAVPLVLRLRATQASRSERTTLRADAIEGMRFVWRSRVIRAVAVGFWIVVFFTASDDLILPFLTTRTFQGGPVAVGVLLAAASVGLLVGLPLVGVVGRRLGATAAVVAGLATMATGNLLTAAAPALALAFAAQLLRGAAIPLANSSVTTLVQRTAPPHLLGRALANVYGGVGVAAAAGYLVGGPVLDATSPRTAFLLVGIGGLVGAATTAVLVRVRPASTR
jgi:MFS family permease